MRERLADFGVGDQVVEECALAAQRFQRPVRLDAAMVDPAREVIEPFGAVAEMRREPDPVPRREIGAREDAEPLHLRGGDRADAVEAADRRSEEHTSELQSLMRTSYAVFCLKKKKTKTNTN